MQPTATTAAAALAHYNRALRTATQRRMQGLPVASSAQLRGRTAGLCRMHGIDPAAGLAAHLAALSGLPHDAHAACIWRRAATRALLRPP